MALDACTYLKAWLLEEIEHCLEHQNIDTTGWAEQLRFSCGGTCRCLS